MYTPFRCRYRGDSGNIITNFDMCRKGNNFIKNFPLYRELFPPFCVYIRKGKFPLPGRGRFEAVS